MFTRAPRRRAASDLDETKWIASREREPAEKTEAKIRRKLADKKAALPTYRSIILKQVPLRESRRKTAPARTSIKPTAPTKRRRPPSAYPISDVGYRIICTYLEYADADLTNCFVSRSTIADDMGMTVRTLAHHLELLAPYMRAYAYNRDDGTVSSNGTQFLLPADVIALGASPWEGATHWDKRRTPGIQGPARTRKARRQ